jgi:GR25 family glycosyltransferase involved in LPS biosynthesis
MHYSVISINDKRKINKDQIFSVLGKDNLVDVKFVDGTNVKSLEKFLYLNNDLYFSWNGWKLGEIGCFASNYNIWKYLLKSNLKEILVFEDDAWIENNFILSLNKAIKYLPKDYDVFSAYVDKNQHKNFDFKAHHVNDLVSKSYQNWSALCYVVSKKGAKKMINYVKNNGLSEPVDDFIFNSLDVKGFNTYTFHPNVVCPVKIKNITGSNIQNTNFLFEDEMIMFDKIYRGKGV